jgi:hypothetical protein
MRIEVFIVGGLVMFLLLCVWPSLAGGLVYASSGWYHLLVCKSLVAAVSPLGYLIVRTVPQKA